MHANRSRRRLPCAIGANYGAFQAQLTIWRNGTLGPNTFCSNDHLERRFWFREVVLFDEEENAVGYAPEDGCYMECIPEVFPATGRHDVEGDLFPSFDNASVGGWLYLNLDSHAKGVTQSWVTASLRAEGKFSADIDAIALGNGCSPAPDVSEIDPRGVGVIGPAPNRNRQ